MKLAIAAFTRAGGVLADRLREQLVQEGHQVLDNALFCTGVGKPSPAGGLSLWVKDAFAGQEGLIFVGACGIAVRAIAPHIKDKLTDPAVVSIDQEGRFAVALLSSHVGGAGKLAQQVARMCGGVSVISTATDLTGCFAVDVWAARHGLTVGDRLRAKEISAALLEGSEVGFHSDFVVAGSLPEGLTDDAELGICISHDRSKSPFPRTLSLVPRWIVLGVGCRKGVSVQEFETEIIKILSALQIEIREVEQLATIDLKKTEPCIRAFCKKYSITLTSASAEELNRQKGDFSRSEFVKKTVGTDNVCERAVVWAGAKIIAPKVAGNGVTLAVGMRKRSLDFASI